MSLSLYIYIYLYEYIYISIYLYIYMSLSIYVYIYICIFMSSIPIITSLHISCFNSYRYGMVCPEITTLCTIAGYLSTYIYILQYLPLVHWFSNECTSYYIPIISSSIYPLYQPYWNPHLLMKIFIMSHVTSPCMAMVMGIPWGTHWETG